MPAGGFGGFGGWGNPAASVDIRAAIGATPEEWKVIGQLLEKYVMAKMRLEQSEAGIVTGGNDMFAMFGNDAFNGPGDKAEGNMMWGGGFGGPGMPGMPTTAPAPQTQPQATTTAPATQPSGEKGTLAQAITDLKKAADDKSVSDEQLKEKMRIVRAARAKGQKQVEEARENLRRLLTTRQEALLVDMGYID